MRMRMNPLLNSRRTAAREIRAGRQEGSGGALGAAGFFGVVFAEALGFAVDVGLLLARGLGFGFDHRFQPLGLGVLGFFAVALFALDGGA